MKTSSVLIISAIALAGCRPKLGPDNPDVAGEFRDNKYAENIVTGEDAKEYEDQGESISPATLASIEQTIQERYTRDFARCLEDEMEKQGTRFLRSGFTLEFDINTDGVVYDAKVLDIGMSKQNAKGADLGKLDAGGMKGCLESVMLAWTFEPAPEVDYKHTYRGQAGEAY